MRSASAAGTPMAGLNGIIQPSSIGIVHGRN
jgi:hypothetical protein